MKKFLKYKPKKAAKVSTVFDVAVLPAVAVVTWEKNEERRGDHQWEKVNLYLFINHNWVCVGQVNQLIRKLMLQMCEFFVCILRFISISIGQFRALE